MGSNHSDEEDDILQRIVNDDSAETCSEYAGHTQSGGLRGQGEDLNV